MLFLTSYNELYLTRLKVVYRNLKAPELLRFWAKILA